MDRPLFGTHHRGGVHIVSIDQVSSGLGRDPLSATGRMYNGQEGFDLGALSLTLELPISARAGDFVRWKQNQVGYVHPSQLHLQIVGRCSSR